MEVFTWNEEKCKPWGGDGRGGGALERDPIGVVTAWPFPKEVRDDLGEDQAGKVESGNSYRDVQYLGCKDYKERVSQRMSGRLR
jgi:hypothetical protein